MMKWKQNENKISNQRSTFLDDRDSRLAGAEFLEVSADLYALVPFSDQQIGSKNQVRKYTYAELTRALRYIKIM